MDDPRLALQWLDSITSLDKRQQAMSNIVMVWQSSNAADLKNWVNSLPTGTARDDAVTTILAMQREPDSESQRLIETIADAGKRKQAELGMVMRLMHSDPQRAERMLAELALTDTERQEYQQMLEQAKYSGYGMSY